MDPLLIAAHAQPAALRFGAVEIQIEGGPLRVSTGGVIVFDVDGQSATFLPRSPAYGILSELGAVKDGADIVASAWQFGIYPRDDAAMAALASPSIQDARVRFWYGVLNKTTGLPEGAPELVFEGEINQPSVSVADNWSIQFACSAMDARQKRPDSQRRLSHSFHQYCHPGELGLEHNTEAASRQIYWRMNEPRGAVRTSGGGGGTGGVSNPGGRPVIV